MTARKILVILLAIACMAELVVILGLLKSPRTVVQYRQACPTSKPTEARIRFVDATLEAGIRFENEKGVPSMAEVLAGMGLKKLMDSFTDDSRRRAQSTMFWYFSKYMQYTMGPGAAFGDYDNDGRPDLYLCSSGPPEVHPQNKLYRNKGNGTFTEVTVRAGVGYSGWSQGAVWADVDNDGWLDLYVANAGPNVLYHNNGDGTFTDITDMAGVGDPSYSLSAAFSDVDRDGFLDLYVANYADFTKQPDQPEPLYLADLPGSRNSFYHNRGDGTFVEEAVKTGLGEKRYRSMGVVFADHDNDGDPDLYVANDRNQNLLFRNRGDGTFEEIGEEAKVDDPGSSMGVAFGDYDNDGFLDLVVANLDIEYTSLFHNDGNGKFTNLACLAGIGQAGIGHVNFGTEFVDFDQDGLLDLFFASGNISGQTPQDNLVFQNNADGTFVDLSQQSGINTAGKWASRGATFADCDGDGDVDIYVANNKGRGQLLRNESIQGRWLTVKLVGTKSNRFGVGSRIRVEAEGRSQIREIVCGSGYLGGRDLTAHFGIGQAQRVDRLEIKWPSGLSTVLQNLPANRVYTVEERPASPSASSGNQ